MKFTYPLMLVISIFLSGCGKSPDNFQRSMGLWTEIGSNKTAHMVPDGDSLFVVMDDWVEKWTPAGEYDEANQALLVRLQVVAFRGDFENWAKGEKGKSACAEGLDLIDSGQVSEDSSVRLKTLELLDWCLKSAPGQTVYATLKNAVTDDPNKFNPLLISDDGKTRGFSFIRRLTPEENKAFIKLMTSITAEKAGIQPRVKAYFAAHPEINVEALKQQDEAMKRQEREKMGTAYGRQTDEATNAFFGSGEAPVQAPADAPSEAPAEAPPAQ